MPAAMLQQGATSIRDALKTLLTHVCVSDDTLAFADTQTGINPTEAATSTHVEAASNADVDYRTFDASITITGATEFTNLPIYSIGVAKGSAIRSATGAGGTHTGGGTVGTDTVSRSVRGAGLGIGVQSGDTFTLAARVQVQDNS